MSVMGRSLPPLVSGIQKRLLASVTTIVFFGGLLSLALAPQTAYAGSIGNRSLTLQSGTDSNADGIADGGSMPGGYTNHAYSIVLPQVGTPTVGSVKFEYCNEPAGTCTAPTGMSLSTPGATMGATGGGANTAFDSFTVSSANVGYLTRATPLSMAAGITFTATINNVKNPTTTNFTFFVRIGTYALSNATGSPIDSGTVAASTATQIELTGTMPESLVFCAGETVPNNVANTAPTCTGTTAGIISFDQLFSPSDTAFAKSQMAASTNALSGYVISVSGPTLSSGSYSIAAMGSVSALNVGTPQFGFNLRANSNVFDNQGTPALVGTAIFPASNGTNLRAQAVADYRTDNQFKFVNEPIARSDDATPGPTDLQRYTVNYVVNVPGSQPAGTYKTTLTYVCTALF